MKKEQIVRLTSGSISFNGDYPLGIIVVYIRIKEMRTIEDMKLELLSDDSNRFIQALIDYDINSKDKYGSNLLHYYIMNYKSIVHPAGVIIPEFVKKGLDINEKRKDGRTALYLSVQYQLKGIFELLLNHNADIDMQNANGNTPLWEAVMQYKGDGFFIEHLLKNGANPDIENNNGVSPKSLARTIANYDVRRFFNNDNKQQTD